MQRDPRSYRDAARLLWDLPPERLSNLASGELTSAQSVRDAAQMALGVKREYLSPEEFGSEDAALDRLAANLSMLPDFSLQEIALASGSGPIKTSPVPSDRVAPTPRRRRTAQILLLVAILLLALEALAAAGVSVPSPIGIVVDRLGGDTDEASDLENRTDPEAAGSVSSDGAFPGVLEIAGGRLRPESRAAEPRGLAKPKNENHAEGRELHQAQGREEHQPDDRGSKRVAAREESPGSDHRKSAVERIVKRAKKLIRDHGLRGRGRDRSK